MVLINIMKRALLFCVVVPEEVDIEEEEGDEVEIDRVVAEQVDGAALDEVD